MEIELLHFEWKATKTKLADVFVKYGNLAMKCELAYHPKDKKAWIRMPERWLNKNYKLKYCYWVKQDFSDEFQNIVLNKIFNKHNLTDEKIAERHEAWTKEKKKK